MTANKKNRSVRILALLFGVSLAVLGSMAVRQSPQQPPEQVQLDRNSSAKRVAPKPGDVCAVCGQPVGDDGVAYEAEGHHIAIHRDELAPDLAAQLRGLLRKLQPRGAFLGTSDQYGGLGWWWFFIGLYVLLGLGFAALCAHRALHTGHRPVVWFFAGLLFTAFAYLVLLTRPQQAVHAPGGIPRGLGKFAATLPPQECPGCGAQNHPAASRCSGCGGKLEPRIESEAARVLSRLN